MNNPVNALLDGLSVTAMHWFLLLSMLLVLFASLAWLASILQRMFGEGFTPEEYLSLSLAGWLLPATLLALLWYAIAKIVSPLLGLVVAGILVFTGFIFYLQAPKPAAGRSYLAVSLIVFLAGLFILLRLAFVSGAVVPLYFDSAQHYRYISQLLSGLGSSAGIGQLTGYYHLGFHFLAAFLAFHTRAEITDVMLILGQVILALMPFSFFFIVRHGSGSNLAGFLAVVLAAFGWYMPAHAMDWGKYPALASLALIPFVVSLVHLAIRNRKILSLPRYGSLIVLLLAGIFVSIMLHSRSLVIYLLLALALGMTWGWSRLGKNVRFVLLGVVVLILIGEIVLIQSRGILDPLFDTYGRDAIFTGICVLLLSLFTLRFYPGLVFFCIVSTSLFAASLFIPIQNVIPGFANTTLLDRPYVQMILYMPLTVLGGFGLAGLEHLLQGKHITLAKMRLDIGKFTGVFFILLVCINALFKYDLYPSDCCKIMSRDDLAAIQWMEANLPKEALILASSTDLNVLPTKEFQGSAGGDAGTWITPLTGRPVFYMPFSTDFSLPQTLDVLCAQHIEYIYVGKTGWYFDDTRMQSQPAGYKLLLDIPKAKLYEVIGCK